MVTVSETQARVALVAWSFECALEDGSGATTFARAVAANQ